MDLKPKILVYYDRESYLGEDNLRITFDSNLSYRDQNLDFKRSSKDHRVFKDTDKNIVMEIKAHGVLPLWLVRTLSREHLYPVQFSKIGTVFNIINHDG